MGGFFVYIKFLIYKKYKSLSPGKKAGFFPFAILVYK
jgi:hypothetical protein